MSFFLHQLIYVHINHLGKENIYNYQNIIFNIIICKNIYVGEKVNL